MAMVFFMMLLSLTHLSASVKSQNSVVNLTLKNVSVEQALTKVEKQLKQNFFFNRENVDLERKVDLQLSDADLDELVLQLFGRDYKYRVVDNIIVVSRKDEEQEQPQQIKVEGVVKDKRGDRTGGQRGPAALYAAGRLLRSAPGTGGLSGRKIFPFGSGWCPGIGILYGGYAG